MKPASLTDPSKPIPSTESVRDSDGLADQSLDHGQPRRTAEPTRLAFSVRETANMLGVSEKTVLRLVSRGLLHASRALRHLRISRKEIERFLDQTTR